ncbi:MAG TPA: aminotransferase class IV [Pirellulales bacterium]|jgi:branched-chain amino acid aminotransferase|nr:aminotransferase class IV [Pirellulales bacterium]
MPCAEMARANMPRAEMSEALVYLNGRVLPAPQAHLAIFDAGVVMGATVTEMTRTFRRQPFRLEEHLERLFRSLHYVRFAIDETKDRLADVSRELVAHNATLLPDGGELGLIQFVTAGEVAGYAGLAPTADKRGKAGFGPCTVCIHTFPLCWDLWAEKMRSGAHLVTPSIRHVPPQCIDPKMKYRSRMHYYLADQEARLVDPNASALLLDLDGNVTETSAANFLFVERGTIISPTTRNTLPGISRATVIELAVKLGIGFVERDSQTYHAVNADEAFLTSTPYCLMPVTKINGLSIGDGKPGPIFRRLLDAWSELVGLDIERQIIEGASEQELATAR